MFRRIVKIIGPLTIVGLLLTTPACSRLQPNLTPIEQVENISGQIESTVDQLVLGAKALNVSNPTVMTDARLVSVAIFGDKIGREGTDLSTAITAYNNLKAAGSDTSLQVAAIQKIIASISQGCADLGKAIPNGTIAAVDQTITSILTLIAQVKVGVGL